jgi:hypothetical protein
MLKCLLYEVIKMSSDCVSTLKDFQPINTWKVDSDGPTWDNDDEPMYIIDQTTGKQYWNDSPSTLRIKSLLLTLGTPLIHTIALSCGVVYRILKLVTFYNFWAERENEDEYDFKARSADAGKDLLRIITTPLSLIALELGAIYGLLRPNDGRKLYASIEMVTYENFTVAPCFHPDPIYHLFGGNPFMRNSY